VRPLPPLAAAAMERAASLAPPFVLPLPPQQAHVTDAETQGAAAAALAPPSLFDAPTLTASPHKQRQRRQQQQQRRPPRHPASSRGTSRQASQRSQNGAFHQGPGSGRGQG
jgi:hypothetical protein